MRVERKIGRVNDGGIMQEWRVKRTHKREMEEDTEMEEGGINK